MKIKRISVIFALVLAAACMFLFACGPSAGSQNGGSNYVESTARINNPDQGFYRPIYVRVNDDGASYNKNIVNDATQLYHLRIDISAFSAAVNNSSDKQLTQAALDGLTEILEFIKQKDKNAVVRLAYDPSYGGSKDKEPSMQTILTHVEQACGVFSSYENTITAIEVGLIGPWGEMHSSAIANAQHITPIVEAFLDHTDNIPVLVRTPKMIYDYLGIAQSEVAGYTVAAENKAYRLGLFNDGYLGSDSDLGTYSDRQRDVAFLSGQTEHLPFGGEVVVPDSKLHDINVCLPEMFQINLSYLNVEWNNQVVDKWKNSAYTKSCGADKKYYGKTAFEYIENHMGYRYVMTSSTVAYSTKTGKLKADIKLKNVGFGNLNKKKQAQLVFVGENGDVLLTKDVGEFGGSDRASYSVELDSKPEKCDVYLRLYGEQYNGAYLYCLQFASDGVWNATLKANKIGSIK